MDTVLYFEGDKTLPYRVLRAVKNRYGSTNEIGMFDMTGRGLAQIENPSQVMLEGRPLGISGTCVACVMEGTRPVLSEIQALATKTSFPSPRRTASGFDYNRMYLLLAVLEKRAGYAFYSQDVYINIIGGLKLDETACDLPVCIALASSLLDLPVNEKPWPSVRLAWAARYAALHIWKHACGRHSALALTPLSYPSTI